jgi:hypothetical protein
MYCLKQFVFILNGLVVLLHQTIENALLHHPTDHLRELQVCNGTLWDVVHHCSRYDGHIVRSHFVDCTIVSDFAEHIDEPQEDFFVLQVRRKLELVRSEVMRTNATTMYADMGLLLCA